MNNCVTFTDSRWETVSWRGGHCDKSMGEDVEGNCLSIIYGAEHWQLEFVVSIVSTLRAGRSGFEFWQAQNFFISSESSRPALGPTQPPVQCVPWFFPEGKWPGREVDPSPPYSAGARALM
jgi:hypothetical protein